MSSTDLTPGIHNEPDIHLPKDLKIKTFRALVTQNGTAAPTMTILQNTLGVVPVFTYDAVGVYPLTATGAFVEGKTFARISQSALNAIATVIDYGDLPNILYVETTNGAGINQNSQLYRAALEILVYA